MTISTSDIDQRAMASIRQRFQRFHTPIDEQAIQQLDRQIDNLLQKQITDTSKPRYGGWDEPLPADHPLYTGGGNMLDAMGQLTTAWATPTSRYHRSDKLSDRIDRAWQCSRKMIHPGCPFIGNWWSWQFAMTRSLTMMPMLAPELWTGTSRKECIETATYLVEQIPDEHPGANGMSAAQTFARFGVLTEQPDWINKAVQNVDRVCQITDYQGILSDYTYSFHGRGLNMGYGSLHFDFIGQLTYLLGDSPWRLSDQTYSNAVNMLLEFVRWVVVGNTLDPFIVGRGISYSEDRMKATPIIDGALLLSTGPIPRKNEVQDACTQLLDGGAQPNNPAAVHTADQLPPSTSSALTGMRFWPEGEYAAMRHEDWTATIKMATEKNKCYFGINRSNLKGWHISDGQFILRFTGDEYKNHVLPTMDWERLSGITRADGFKLPAETRGQSWYCAGATDDDTGIGCCGLLFTIINLDRTTLEAFKTWFFLGDAIVALGSSIRCDGDDMVETIIRHVPLPESEEPRTEMQTRDTKFLAGHDCAYILPDEPTVHVSTQQRFGQWADLRDDVPPGEEQSRWYWTALLQHGVKPSDAGYTIVYLPGKTAQEAEQWWQTRPFEISRREEDIHELIDLRQNRRLTVKRWFGAAVELCQH